MRQSNESVTQFLFGIANQSSNFLESTLTGGGRSGDPPDDGGGDVADIVVLLLHDGDHLLLLLRHLLRLKPSLQPKRGFEKLISHFAFYLANGLL